MIAEVSIYPLGKVHYSDALANVIEELNRARLEYQLGPMGTAIQGSDEKVFKALEQCLQVAKNFSERVVMHIAIDKKATADEHLSDRVDKVLGRVNPR